jgi:hypothetical protein
MGSDDRVDFPSARPLFTEVATLEERFDWVVRYVEALEDHLVETYGRDKAAVVFDDALRRANEPSRSVLRTWDEDLGEWGEGP